ncbi:MAG: NAD(P)H-hydrate epimerase, partial [Thermoprotei archaeon]
MAISTLEMRVLEENSEYLGVSKLLLMENAGRRVAEFCMRILGNKEARVLVVAGPGNNGGDGFVAARYLAQTYKVRVFLLARPSEIRTLEARKNWAILEKMRLSMELHYGYDLQKLKEIIKDSDLIVDAIFGTGLKGVVKEPYKTAIEYLNSSRKIIVAVDVPSGLNPDTGEVHGVAVKASYTITFHCVKKGLETGRNY